MVDGHVAGSCAGGVLLGERVKLPILDAEAGDRAGGFVVERVDLRSGVKKIAAGRKGDPIYVFEFGGYASGGKFCCHRIPIEGEDTIGLSGADEDALAWGGSENRRCGGEGSGRGCHEEVTAIQIIEFVHGKRDCRRWDVECASHMWSSTLLHLSENR